MTQNVATAKRVATALAVLSLLACLVGSIRLIRVVLGNAHTLPGFVIWMLLPTLMAGIGVLASRRARVGAMWSAIGVTWGFVVLGAWSLGLFYAPAALLLTAAGIAHSIAAHSWWRALMAPLWLAAGVFGTAPMFLAADVIGQTLGHGLVVTHAPAVTFGSWLFVTVVTTLIGAHAARWIWCTSRASRPALTTVTLVVDLVIVLLVGRAAVGRGVNALGSSGSHGSSCWAENGRTQCESW